MVDKNIVGYNIKKLRCSNNLSQKEVIARLHLLGVKLDEIKLSRIEHLKRPVLDYELLAFSKALNVDINSFFK